MHSVRLRHLDGPGWGGPAGQPSRVISSQQPKVRTDVARRPPFRLDTGGIDPANRAEGASPPAQTGG
jgi:hypothetical protein